MKNLLLIIGVLIVIAGCSNNEQEQEQLWYSYGTYLNSDSSSIGYVIELDNGNLLVPTEAGYIDNNVTDSSRIVVLYSIVSEQNNAVSAKVNEIIGVLTKGVIQLTEYNKDSIGDDAVVVYEDDIWFSENHLNVQFSYYAYSTTHFINLVKPIDSILDENGRQILEFRHNSNKDYPSIVYKSAVSFDMWSLYEDGMDSINFVFKSTDYNGYELNWEGTYFFNKNTSVKKSSFTNPIHFNEVY